MINYTKNDFGPRHTPNPSPLNIFWVQRITRKKLMNFSEKFYWQFKTILHLSPKLLKRHYPLKIRPDFDLKELDNFSSWKRRIFWSFFDILKFHSQKKLLVLTKCWLKYYRSIGNLLLMFFIFWTNAVSPKLKKNLIIFFGRLKGQGFWGMSRVLGLPI